MQTSTRLKNGWRGVSGEGIPQFYSVAAFRVNEQQRHGSRRQTDEAARVNKSK